MAGLRPRRDGGFTYLSLIILVAIIGLVSASALKLGSVIQRSRAEQELLVIGAAFSDALQSYADATPPGMPTQPPSLNALLKDPRFPGVRRHLRKLYVDPMTGKAEWGIVYLGNNTGILAIYSLSKTKPVKIAGFAKRFNGLENKNFIYEWKFFAAKKELANESVAPTQPKPLMPDLLPHDNQSIPDEITRPEPVKVPVVPEIAPARSDEGSPQSGS